MAETIFALSSGKPPAGIAVIRVSGPDAGSALIALSGRLPSPRRAAFLPLYDENHALLDQALVLWLPGPDTVTGEDIAELHCHGGRAVIRAVEEVLARIPGLRGAEAGEFTRRAFLNGRMDLIEAEGLADLLLAETDTQRRAALALQEGHLTRRVDGWRITLLKLSAMVEACLDFSDEDDVPDQGAEQFLRDGLDSLLGEIQAERTRPDAERLRDGIRVVIGGPPNAGKSTLLNALAGRDAAIVSEIAGTTRDRIEVPVAIDGIAYLLTDTAGLRDREGSDPIEWQGIGMARAALDAADVILWLGDPNEVLDPDRSIIISAKADMHDAVSDDRPFRLSAQTGEGMACLTEEMARRARQFLPGEGEYALHARQRAILKEVSGNLHIAVQERDLLLVAEHLRSARLEIDKLTGKASTEDMLDTLFAGFCIGK